MEYGFNPFPLDKDGKLKSETRLISFTGNSLDKERQTQPHLHCIEFTPDHKYLLFHRRYHGITELWQK